MATRVMRVVGKALPRFDAPGKVTGTAVYAADFALPGMLVGKVFRSTEPHARIVRLDVTRARTPGRARARAVSRRTMRACGSVLRNTLPTSMPGSAKSAA